MKALKFIGFVFLACSFLFVSCKKTKQYTITVTVNDATMGSATGGGVYDEKATATLEATANTFYKFLKWADGNTDNPRSVTVTGNATYEAVFTVDGEEPQEDGLYVTMGSESWQVMSFQADVESMPGKIRIWLYKSAETDYPQFQGWMDAHTGDNVSASLVYMANENDMDASAYPNWESTALTTKITAIELNAKTITAEQIGKMHNRSTSEERSLHIFYKNVTWESALTPSKFWMSAF